MKLWIRCLVELPIVGHSRWLRGGVSGLCRGRSVLLALILVGWVVDVRAEGNLDIPDDLSKSARKLLQGAINRYKHAEDTGGKGLEKAVSAFKKARKKAKNCHLIPYYLGASYQKLRLFKKSAEEFEFAVSLREGFNEALMGLAEVQTVLGKYADAESNFDFAIKKDKYLPAYDGKIMLLIRQGRYDDARLLCLEAQKVERTEPRARLIRRIGQVIRPGWGTTQTATSNHYEVKTNISVEYAKEIAKHAELIHSKFDELFAKKLAEGELVERRMEIWVYDSRSSFPKRKNKFGGFYDKIFRHVAIIRREEPDKMYSNLFHLLFHQYADAAMARSALLARRRSGAIFRYVSRLAVEIEIGVAVYGQ